MITFYNVMFPEQQKVQVIKSMVSRVKLLEANSESTFYWLHDCGPISLGLSLHVCEIEINMVPSSQGSSEEEMSS